MDISDIPTEELVSDYFETLHDLRLCAWAVDMGIDIYGPDNSSTKERLDINTKIEAKIKAELTRRGVPIPTTLTRYVRVDV